MSADMDAIMKLEVPLIVVIDERPMSLEAVMRLVPGAIIELPREADDELDVMVNNKVIGRGRAVKIGENFGVRIEQVGDLEERVRSMGAAVAVQPTG